MLALHSDYTHSIQVPASPEEVFAVLSDVPRSVSHFPDLEQFEPHSDGYRWVLKKAGMGKLSLQMRYACSYRSDAARGTVHWDPIDKVGNARVEGSWTIRPHNDGTEVTLHNDLTLFVKAPRLLRRAAEPVVDKENGRILEGYLNNLSKTFSGGDGRVNRW